jgi:hypothetical protein
MLFYLVNVIQILAQKMEDFHLITCNSNASWYTKDAYNESPRALKIYIYSLVYTYLGFATFWNFVVLSVEVWLIIVKSIKNVKPLRIYYMGTTGAIVLANCLLITFYGDSDVLAPGGFRFTGCWGPVDYKKSFYLLTIPEIIYSVVAFGLAFHSAYVCLMITLKAGSSDKVSPLKKIWKSYSMLILYLIMQLVIYPPVVFYFGLIVGYINEPKYVNSSTDWFTCLLTNFVNESDTSYLDKCKKYPKFRLGIVEVLYSYFIPVVAMSILVKITLNADVKMFYSNLFLRIFDFFGIRYFLSMFGLIKNFTAVKTILPSYSIMSTGMSSKQDDDDDDDDEPNKNIRIKNTNTKSTMRESIVLTLKNIVNIVLNRKNDVTDSSNNNNNTTKGVGGGKVSSNKVVPSEDIVVNNNNNNDKSKAQQKSNANSISTVNTNMDVNSGNLSVLSQQTANFVNNNKNGSHDSTDNNNKQKQKASTNNNNKSLVKNNDVEIGFSSLHENKNNDDNDFNQQNNNEEKKVVVDKKKLFENQLYSKSRKLSYIEDEDNKSNNIEMLDKKYINNNNNNNNRNNIAVVTVEHEVLETVINIENNNTNESVEASSAVSKFILASLSGSKKN